MSQAKKKILIQVQDTLNPCDTGFKSRILAVLKYFRDRKEFFVADVVANNNFGFNTWNWEQKQEVLKFVDNIFIYEGEHQLFDFLYSQSKSFYYQKVLRQQLPIDSSYFTPPGYVKFVKTLVSERAYDFAWINCIDYAHLAVDSKSAPIHTIIDIHDLGCDLRIARKNIPYLKKLKFDYESNFNREIKLLNKFDNIVATSQHEMAIISSHLSPHKLYLIPHIIEKLNHAEQLVPYSHREFKYDLLFVGTAYLPNVNGIKFFLNYIFPDIIRRKPDTKLVLAGTVTSLVQIDTSLEKNVDCLGYVPDLSELYLKSRLVICPLLDGSGTKVKLVEAMAYGIPVVTTKTGASELSLVDGINAFITDEPSLYAHHILNLLQKPEIAQNLSQEITMTFESYYSKSVVYSKLDQMFGISPS